MGLFSSLFGSSKKPDIGSIYSEPPKRQYDKAAYDEMKKGYKYLTDTFTNRSQGNDIFDYIKYLFEPQSTALNQEYGINTGDPHDVYSSKTGILPQTLASLNSRGLLDSGTSGLIEGQLRSNAANKRAELFGNAKQLQRQDIDNALDNLHTLYPENFNVADIPYAIDYENAMNSYGVGVQRNAAQQAYESMRGPKTLFQQSLPLIGQAAGTAIGSYFGMPSFGGQLGGNLGGMFGNNSAGYNYKSQDQPNNNFLNSSFLDYFSKNRKESRSGSGSPGMGSYYNTSYFNPFANNSVI